MKMKASRCNHWWTVGIALFLSFGLLGPGANLVWGKNGKGSRPETPDFEEALSDGQDMDADSLAELERVIEAEEDVPEVRNERVENEMPQVKASKRPESGVSDAEIDEAAFVDPVGGNEVAEKSNPKPISGVTDAEIEEALFPDPTAEKPAARRLSQAPKRATSANEDSSSLPEFEDAPAATTSSPTSASRPALNEELPRSDVKNEITNLEFKMEGNNSRIVVTSRRGLRYREVRNPQVKQVVYFFENTETPSRLQRAYDTTEFVSPVALFTLLQMPKETPPVTKLIVQLREEKSPVIIPNERGIYIDFPPPDKRDEQRLILGDNDPRLATEENIYSGAQTFSGKSISRLEVKNTDVQDVLRLIAKSSGYNIVIGDDVNGKVGTLSLQNVPWDQAFALVLQSKKLGYIRQGNVIRVATLGALKSEKEEAFANEASKLKVEPLRTVLIPISYAKAQDLSTKAKSFLTERGSFDVDTRTNTVIVKDVDRAVTRIQKLFSALDTQPARVSISAKIVEMTSDFSRNVGFGRFAFQQNLGGVSIGNNFDTTLGKFLDTSNFGGKGANTLTLSAPNFARLQTQFLLEEIDGKTRTLANPSVTVVANQSATINQSVSFFVINTDAVAGGQLIPGVRQITANLNMDVTPIVAGDGSIFMTVNIKNEIPKGTPPNITIDSRNLQTQLLVENGDTAVVGGIFSNTTFTGKTGVPFLMRVPILGFFFSANSLTENKNEIFIFLTAKILNPEESFKRNL